jgi:hypothetical protein
MATADPFGMTTKKQEQPQKSKSNRNEDVDPRWDDNNLNGWFSCGGT